MMLLVWSASKPLFGNSRKAAARSPKMAESTPPEDCLSAIFGDRAAALKELPNNGLDADQTNKIINDTLQ